MNYRYFTSYAASTAVQNEVAADPVGEEAALITVRARAAANVPVTASLACSSKASAKYYSRESSSNPSSTISHCLCVILFPDRSVIAEGSSNVTVHLVPASIDFKKSKIISNCSLIFQE